MEWLIQLSEFYISECELIANTEIIYLVTGTEIRVVSIKRMMLRRRHHDFRYYKVLEKSTSPCMHCSSIESIHCKT